MSSRVVAQAALIEKCRELDTSSGLSSSCSGLRYPSGSGILGMTST